jgi:hypothetical protein
MCITGKNADFWPESLFSCRIYLPLAKARKEQTLAHPGKFAIKPISKLHISLGQI